MKKISSPKNDKNTLQRLEEARKNLEKLNEELKPFTKPRKVKQVSSTGQWIDGTSIELLSRES
jgi:hypothetical protein